VVRRRPLGVLADPQLLPAGNYDWVIASIDLGIPGLTNIERIGRGGNAVVYRARQEDLDRDVVVKVLLSVDAETTRRRFNRERRAMGRLSQSAGIAPLYGSGFTPDDRPYLLMPFYEYGSLHDRLVADGALPAEEVQQIGITVAKAIQTAHENGVLHRDLKPANILMSRTGNPDVADFGIAHLVDDALGTSQALTMTPLYTAPEVFDGIESGAASDIYSVGATIYALLNGHPAYSDPQGGTPVLTLMRRINEDPLPPLPAEIPTELAAVVAKAMSKDPAARQRSAGQLAAELASANMAAPRASQKRSRSMIFAAVAMVVAIAGGVVAAMFLLDDDQTAGQPNVAATAVPTVEEVFAPASPTAVPGEPATEGDSGEFDLAAASAAARQAMVRIEAFSCAGAEVATGVALNDGQIVTTQDVLNSPWYIDVEMQRAVPQNAESAQGLAFVFVEDASGVDPLPGFVEVAAGDQVAVVGIDGRPALAVVDEVDGKLTAELIDGRSGNAIQTVDIVVTDSGLLVGIATVDTGEITIVPPTELQAGDRVSPDYGCESVDRDLGPRDAESVVSPAIAELLTMQQLNDAYADEEWSDVRQLEPARINMTDQQFINGWRPLRTGFVYPVDRVIQDNGLSNWRIALIGHETWNGNDLTTLFCLTWTVDPVSGAVTQTNQDTVTIFGSRPDEPQRVGFADPAALRGLIDENCARGATTG